MNLPSVMRIHSTNYLFQTVVIIFVALFPRTATGTELIATITYSNSSANEIKNIRHQITIPPDTSYQKVTGLRMRNIDNYELHNHKNNIDRYLSFDVDLAPDSSVSKEITFTIKRLRPSFSYRNTSKAEIHGSLKKYLEPSTNIESDAREIKAIANLIAGKSAKLDEQLEKAYGFPDAYLNFNPQGPTSALKALKSGFGDCTEFAYLFVALSRNLNIPSRVISGFFFGKNRTFRKPNHHAAEIFLESLGWVPVFPNLGNTKYSKQFGLGKIPDTFITLKRSNVWTWANSFPRHPKGISQDVKTKVSWTVVD